MSLRGVWRLQQAKRWLKYRYASRALILMYHRVTKLSNDPFLLSVTPEHFAEQLEVIRSYTTPIRLGKLIEALRTGKVPNRAVVLTFDDGYSDNLYQAKPLLEHYEIPATAFVTAGQVGNPREFWWDELDRLLLQPGRLPERLRLNVNSRLYDWELGEAVRYTKEEYQRERGWHVEYEHDPGPRQRLFRELYEKLYGLPNAERRILLDELLAWSGSEPAGRSSHRALTLDEILQLTQGGLVEIGAHTMNHAILAAIPAAEQQNEIRQSKACLESILQSPVTSFAYPNGSSTPASVAILQEAGFMCACSSQAEAVWRGADFFYLPRLGVRNWDRETFTRWLKWWIDG